MSEQRPDSWESRMESKVDALVADVAVLKDHMTWRTKLLIVIGTLLGAIATALLNPGCAHPAPYVSPPPDAAVAAPPDRLTGVVAVVCTKPGQEPWLGYGSGVLIGPQEVLTARHVIDCDGGYVYKAMFAAPGYGVTNLRLGRVGATDIDDFAVLISEDVSFREWATVGDDPMPGQQVCMYTLEPSKKLSCGWVNYKASDKPPLQGDGFFRYMPAGACPDGFVVPGNSGSGVYDADNRLVGLHVGHTLTSDNKPTCPGVAYRISRFKDRL